jgi:hypothetical protein
MQAVNRWLLRAFQAGALIAVYALTVPNKEVWNWALYLAVVAVVVFIPSRKD